MGYRSDVAIVIRANPNQPDAKQKFQEQLALMKIEGLFDEMAKRWNPEDWGYNDEMFAFHVEDVKWYVSMFPDVQLVADIWQRFADAENEYSPSRWSGYFLRVGEEYQDVEELFMGDDVPYELMSLERRISLAFSSLPLGNIKSDLTNEENENA